MAVRHTGHAAWRQFIVDGGPPAELETMLDAGRPLLISGRWSQADGAWASKRAAEDLHGAAEELVHRAGIDLRSALPPIEEIRQRLLAAQPRIASTISGGNVRHRFVVIDRIVQAGCVFLVAAGTGSQLDEEGLQPFVEEARRCVNAYRPAVVVCKRFDRLSRHPWAGGSVLSALQNVDAWLCDDENIGPLNDERSILAFVRALGASKEASSLSPKSRRGQRNASGTELVDGQVAYHVAAQPPPGTAVVDLKGSGPKAHRKLMYLDTAACRPDPAQVAAGMPEVLDKAGKPVDHVEIVRFALARVGRPEWPRHRLVAALKKMGFSTPGLRSYRNDNSAIIRNVGPLLTLLGRLDEYESETIQVNLGDFSFIIEGFSPPDGAGWASPADFDRIRQHLVENARAPGRTFLALSGLPATVNGIDARVLTESTPRRGSPPNRYRFVKGLNYPQETQTVAHRALLPHDRIAESIIEGLLAVCDGPLEPLSPIQPPMEDFGLEERAAELERLLTEARDRMERLVRSITSDAETGVELSGPLLRRITKEYNDLAEVEVPKLEEQLAAVRGQIEAQPANPQQGAASSQLLLLVENLRDPSNSTLRGVWRQALTDLTVTLDRIEPDSAPGVAISWQGTILLSNEDGDAVNVPFAGTFDTNSRERSVKSRLRRDERLAADVEEVVDGLRVGQPWPSRFARSAGVVRAVTTRLGYPSDVRPWLVDCDDARIARVATEVRLNPDESTAHIAERLAESPSLVQRVRRLHDQPEGSWLLAGREAEVAMHALASRNAGLVTTGQVCQAIGTSRGTVHTMMYDLRAEGGIWESQRKRGYQMAACSCGSYRRAPTRLREVDGPICLDCRVDKSGVEWPSDPYDTYLAHPNLWRQLSGTEHPS